MKSFRTSNGFQKTSDTTTYRKPFNEPLGCYTNIAQVGEIWELCNMSSMLWHLHWMGKTLQYCFYAYWYLSEEIFTQTLPGVGFLAQFGSFRMFSPLPLTPKLTATWIMVVSHYIVIVLIYYMFFWSCGMRLQWLQLHLYHSASKINFKTSTNKTQTHIMS